MRVKSSQTMEVLQDADCTEAIGGRNKGGSPLGPRSELPLALRGAGSDL